MTNRGTNARPSSAIIASGLIPKLTLLVAMTERGHLSAAADVAGVPQPTATRWIAALSRMVGVPLTRRAGQRVELTAAGRALAESARTAHAVIGAGVARAYEAADPGQGQVRFGFLRTLGVRRAPELLRGYRLAHPRVRLTLVQAAHEQLVAALHEGAVDVALSAVRPTDADVVAVEMFKEPYVLVMPAQHRLARHEFVRLPECRDENFVGLSQGIAIRRSVDEIFNAARVRPRYVFETEEVETVRGLVTAGVGVAVLPARHGGPLSGSVEIPIAPRTYRQIGLLASGRRTLEPVAERFRQWALQQAADGHSTAPVVLNGFRRPL
ncbi:DNA-binding transcriptional LysR family regulator [Catenuloplanes atrovinosus]|uniref:DNA-binding transcriptional LysR family regulator n=1 Tax=Catenuloplanes atrovinosus TaxID=137266 RepID=A0AAE3YPX7_9ACTN|nr:DNA-binding transcriptional LysR family regulator [Catenuloplanes atrovinosus]